MKSMAKRVLIYSMVALMQVGLFATVAEAAPQPEELQRFEYEHQRDHHPDWERERNHRIHEENRRHEREMRRRPFESRREWRERQRHEIERHERAIHRIMEHRDWHRW